MIARSQLKPNQMNQPPNQTDHTLCPKCGRAYVPVDGLLPEHRILVHKRKVKRCKGSGQVVKGATP